MRRQAKFIIALQKRFCNKFIVSLKYFHQFSDYEGLPSKLKEGAVEEEMGCTFYVSTILGWYSLESCV